MLLEKIIIKNFRNIENLELVFGKNLNFLCGSNAQGKTNLLEAIYLCCVGKSPFHKDNDLIKHNEEDAYIKLFGSRQDGNFIIEVFVSKNDKKKIYLNGLVVNKLSEILGHLNAIYFSPDSLKLIKEAPADRRRFLDIDLSQLYKAYCASLLRYNKILLQRNNLLKTSSKSAISDVLSVWDSQLIKEGCFLIEKRKSFIENLLPYVKKVHRFLTSENEEIEVSYKTDVDLNNIKDSYERILHENLNKDYLLKYTSIGPHRDDVKITLNNVDVKNFASQGQQRTAALSLKLAEINYFYDITDEYPLLLLDDVLSELDFDRQQKLIELSGVSQCLITTTSIQESFLNNLNYRVFNVENGVFNKV